MLLLRFVSNWILWRLLFPRAFGLMTLLNTFVQGLQMFSDQGIVLNIVRHERGDDPRFVNTAWTMQVIRGGLLYAIALALAWPLSVAYGIPELRWYFPISALTVVVLGFMSTAPATFNRRLMTWRVVFLDLLGQVSAMTVMIAWASVWPSVWALVAGTLAGGIVRLTVSHFVNPAPGNRFCWDRSAVRSIRSFGNWAIVSSSLSFLGAQADRLLMGWYLSLAVLGVYAQAAVFATALNDLFAQLGSRVVLPSIARLARESRDNLRERLLRHRRLPILAAAAIVACAVASIDLLIHAVYDDRCHAAGWMASVLMFGAWWNVLSGTLGPALLAIDRPRYNALAVGARLMVVGFGIPLAYQAFGLQGVVSVVALGGLPQYLVIQYGLVKNGLSGWRQDLLATLLLAALLAGAFALRAALGVPFDFGVEPSVDG